ncbi:TetR/AcrR family transcriptional regulator [Hydrogenophaga laconesensis]|uniref:TetR/AcrR family transcriptional regulator n=1 Tax=Hydrogenophaga laconesensis TaxID=1805971 RepID=UPI0019561208|nr:TetR/AcrR family transcriptional regulator [Hydrogenophaga laconesensis]
MPKTQATSPEKAPATITRRLSAEDRRSQIVEKAIQHFTRHGFGGSTRELARELGVTQPLLYRYFPSKEALIDRVYDEVFDKSPAWEGGLTDRSVPLNERLRRFYVAYAGIILREEWIRIFIFAGLTKEGINNRYLNKLHARVFVPVLKEVRHSYGISEPGSNDVLDAEVELVWGLHASIFYLGVRKWIYGLKIPKDVDAVIRAKVDTFLAGAPAVMQGMRKDGAGKQ